MFAISLERPWDAAVAHLGKDVENRKWRPGPSMKGARIAVHASKGWDPEAVRYIVGVAPAEERGRWLARIEESRDSCRTEGRIVACATILGWYHIDDFLAPESMTKGRWFFGPWGWHLGDVRALKTPVACSGALSLWRVPEEEEAAVRAQDLEGR